MNMQTSQFELLGITNQDIQEIFERAIDNSKSKNPSLMFLDASYLYTFDLADSTEIRKMNLLIRYGSVPAIEWHRLCERWYQDQTVRNSFGRILKPIKISRTLDRVTNQGMQMIATLLVGSGGDSLTTGFNFRGIGDGAAAEASPASTELANLVDMIDVNNAPEGGSLSRDGTTIYSVGNHSKSVPTPANGEFTECGMFDSDDETQWNMLDHSVFETPIPHTQNADAPGSTTVIYMCSA